MQASGIDVMKSVLKKRLLALLLQGISAVAMVVVLLLPMQCFDVYQAKRGIPVQAQVYRIEQLQTPLLSYWQVTLQLDPKNHILMTDVIPGDWYAPGATAALINQLRQQRQVTLYRTRAEQYFLTQGNYAITLQPAVLAVVWLGAMAWLQRRQLRVFRLQQQRVMDKAKNRQQRSAEAMTNQFLNMPIPAVEVVSAPGVEPTTTPSPISAVTAHGSGHSSLHSSALSQTGTATTADTCRAGQAPSKLATVACVDAVTPVSAQAILSVAAAMDDLSGTAAAQAQTTAQAKTTAPAKGTARSTKVTAELC
jgi:hypothetical protein